MKPKILVPCWAIGIAGSLFLCSVTSAISTKSVQDRKTTKTILREKFRQPNEEESLAKRQAIRDIEDDENEDVYIQPSLVSTRLLKKSQNVSDSDKPDKTKSGKRNKQKEDSPPTNVEIPAEDPINEAEDDEADNGEHLAKADFSRDSRGDKNPRLYYDDARPRYPQYPHPQVDGEDHSYENIELKAKDAGKIYFPKNYVNSKYGEKKPSIPGLSGKRVPDHVNYGGDEYYGGGHHEYPTGHGQGHSLPIIGHHHEEHEQASIKDEAPYGHALEESNNGKSHTAVSGHISAYGHHGHHYGGFRHTIGDKVDAVGKALQVLIPSALLITGVSALFPNRVHVPTSPQISKFRQKRSLFGHREGLRGPRMLPPAMRTAHIPPEFEDIPSHVLHAEHRIMDGTPIDIYPDYSAEYLDGYNAASTITERRGGFDPFKVFKGPGPEKPFNVQHMEDSMPIPPFPHIPQVKIPPITNNYHFIKNIEIVGPEGQKLPSPVYSGEELAPPTSSTPGGPVTQVSNYDNGNVYERGGGNKRTRPTAIIRRRKTTRKPSLFAKEAAKSGHSLDTGKSQYLLKASTANSIEDSPPTPTTQTNPEHEFMTTLRNLVTPDVAKAIVENKKEPPKNVDLSPDSPVMGLLTSYAQHEKDSPICQKRALCELAVKGKSSNATKFEAFLWSVATLVPDVFSEMYDLQEVFQAIRNERCVRFNCPYPNMDLQIR